MLSENASEHAVEFSGFFRILEQIVFLAPKAELWYPSDIFGHASSAGTLEDAKKNLEDIRKYYEDNGQSVGFYIERVSTDDYDSNRLVETFVEKGPVALFAFLQNKPEISNKIKYIRISLTSESQKMFIRSMSSGDYGSLD